MIASPASRRGVRRLAGLWASAGVLAAALAGGAGELLAQQTGAGAPQPGESAVGPPIQLLPFDPSKRQAPGVDPSTESPTIKGFEIDRLSQIDPNAIGVLEQSNGGFGDATWAGSNRAEVMELMRRLPDRTSSAALWSLARRLLLSSARPPQLRDPDPSSAAETPDLSFLILRLERLMALGDLDGLSRLLQKVPQTYQDEAISRFRVESAMLSGNATEACREVGNGITLHHGVEYWQKALVLCQLLAGQTDQAELGLALLRERGLAESSSFQVMVEVLSGRRTDVPVEVAAEPLMFGLLQAKGVPLPAGLSHQAGLALAVAMALSPKTVRDERAKAAERALAVGAIQDAVLADIYDGYVFDSTGLGGDGTDLAGPARHAWLFQRVRQQLAPPDRARVLLEALDEAKPSLADYAVATRVLGPLVAEVPVRTDLMAFAGPMGRALFASGRFEQGGAWLRLARRQANADPLAAKAVAALWPYYRLAGAPTLYLGDDLIQWRAWRSDVDTAELARWSSLLGAALQGLGEGGSFALTSLAAEGEPDLSITGGPAGLSELQAANEAGRRGETVLLVLDLLAGGDLAEVEPRTLNTVLAALSRVDLTAEARALAIEAALANGL